MSTAPPQAGDTVAPPTLEPPGQRRKRWDFRHLTPVEKVVIGVANLAAFFALWELYPRVFDVMPLFLPPFSAVFGELVTMTRSGVLLDSIVISGSIFVASIALAFVLAVPSALAIGGIRWLDRTLTPYIWAIYTLPRIILLPLVLLWVGINDGVRVVMVVISAAPPIMVVVIDSIRTVDAGLIRVARAFGGSRVDLFRRIVLPSVVPFVATGLRLGVIRGLGGLFLAEVFTARRGLGFVMIEASRQFNTARVFALLLVFVLLSLALVQASYYVERRMSSWREAPSGL